MGNFGNILKTIREEVSEEVFEERAEEHRGYDTMEFNEDGTMQEWNPSTESGHTPKPRLLKRLLAESGGNVGDWSEWQRMVGEGESLIIFGAGASTLDQPLHLLDDKIVWGINWTLKWFKPTFLQIIDDDPWQTQVRFNKDWSDAEPDVQVVTSLQCAKKNLGHYKDKALQFRIRQSSKPAKAAEFAFAEHPREIMTWYANSLGYALNSAYFFRPKRIILMGFDFGGPHFFGDGRAAGAMCHYGMEGKMKQRLIPDLERLRDELRIRGQEVVQVGESNLDIFPKVDCLDEVLK